MEYWCFSRYFLTWATGATAANSPRGSSKLILSKIKAMLPFWNERLKVLLALVRDTWKEVSMATAVICSSLSWKAQDKEAPTPYLTTSCWKQHEIKIFQTNKWACVLNMMPSMPILSEEDCKSRIGWQNPKATLLSQQGSQQQPSARWWVGR